jgi:hypothetical protein
MKAQGGRPGIAPTCSSLTSPYRYGAGSDSGSLVRWPIATRSSFPALSRGDCRVWVNGTSEFYISMTVENVCSWMSGCKWWLDWQWCRWMQGAWVTNHCSSQMKTRRYHVIPLRIYLHRRGWAHHVTVRAHNVLILSLIHKFQYSL